MSLVIREFTSVSELIKSIDDAIADLRKILGEYLRKVEELRVKAEQENKLKNILSKLGVAATAPANELNLKTVKVYINPTSEQELASLEAGLENINAKLTQLIAMRKDLDALAPLSDLNVKITVVYVDGLPKTILLKFA